MWKIKYKNNEIVVDENNNPIMNEDGEYQYHLVDLEYPVYTVEDKNKWFDIIQKTYGKYGEVTVVEGKDDRPPTQEQEIELLKGCIMEIADVIYGEGGQTV